MEFDYYFAVVKIYFSNIKLRVAIGLNFFFFNTILRSREDFSFPNENFVERNYSIEHLKLHLVQLSTNYHGRKRGSMTHVIADNN